LPLADDHKSEWFSWSTMLAAAISQKTAGIIEIKGLKTSHFKEIKTAP
jgi:hypothetical protein